MKKILAVLMVLIMVGSLFAYEPKKENVTVKGNKVLYEETYTEYGTFTDTRIWSYKVKSGKFTYYSCSSFDDMWSSLLQNRERYDIHLKAASFKDETCSTCTFL